MCYDIQTVGSKINVNRTSIRCYQGDEQEKSRDRNYKRTRRFQGRIAGNQVMF